ncbi:galactose mutarotase-like protein [Sanghuangporus baumii]|uniref:Galactose mutarotase-like protein n=1 Tax=Sanghuangporus baumii TaxID=108892 RepID=A0A9Q5HXZ7_SANBA|nr:galactose mutarotase-like protein [Sanghuangporus baumii]
MPIMTTRHIFSNLDAFQQGSEDILSHALKIDSSFVVATDSIAILTADFINIDGTAYDSQVAKRSELTGMKRMTIVGWAARF